MAGAAEMLHRAREAVRERDWVAARAGFAAAREHDTLSADDLKALANCHWWLGDFDSAVIEQQEVYRLYLEAGDTAAAALVALDIGYTMSFRGAEAQGSGWMRRAARLLDDHPDGVEQGYLDYVLGFEAAFNALDLDAAQESARRIHTLGRRFDDLPLTALGVMGEGRVLVRRGNVVAGMALLDEAMLAAVSDELDPGSAGSIYCHLMEACYEVSDLPRARQWTEATAQWCERMPGAGPFMGICRVHRAQVLQIRGDWDQAEVEALRVCEEAGRLGPLVAGEAQYQLGEIRRQRGDLPGAAEAYRAAHRWGREPQPGLALLKLAMGDAAGADVSVRSALAAAGANLPWRTRLLPSVAEIAVAAGDLRGARDACEELAAMAATFGTTAFTTQAAHVEAMVLVAEGDTHRALPHLRHALQGWQALGAPYEAARIRVLLAHAYEALGDVDAAMREQTAASEELERIGVSWQPTSVPPRRVQAGGLTQREGEVLAMVARGKTNRQIADELVLSIRTVERHLATVYEKLGVHGRSARAAAVSYALREGILA